MKNIKLSFCTSIVTLALGVMLAYTPATYSGGKSAADCNAATLAQALQGLTMSQHGIVNNAAISLFIVCSVDWENNDFCCGDNGLNGAQGFPGVFWGDGPLGADFRDVVVQASFPPGGVTTADITCVYRSGFHNAPGFFTVAFVIDAGIDKLPFPPIPISEERGQNTASRDLAAPIPNGGVGPNNTVVCGLDPGEGIVAVYTFPFGVFED